MTRVRFPHRSNDFNCPTWTEVHPWLETRKMVQFSFLGSRTGLTTNEPSRFSREFKLEALRLSRRSQPIRTFSSGVSGEELILRTQLAHFVGLIGSRITIQGVQLRLKPRPRKL
jgi:hypothetical protein